MQFFLWNVKTLHPNYVHKSQKLFLVFRSVLILVKQFLNMFLIQLLSKWLLTCCCKEKISKACYKILSTINYHSTVLINVIQEPNYKKPTRGKVVK